MPSLPKLGERFSAFQADLTRNARLVKHEEYNGGMDGVHYLPVHDTYDSFDVNGDGRADFRLITRTQDSGAWSYDGSTGRQVVTQREIELLDAQGRPTDTISALHVHRKGGHVTHELRGVTEMTDLVGSVSHERYLGDGRRDWTYEAVSGKDDGQGGVTVDPATLRSKHQTFD